MINSRRPLTPKKVWPPGAAGAGVLVFWETIPAVPATNVADFIKHLKANPGKLSYGSPGQGSSPHLAGEMFKRMAGVDAVHAPYKGAGPALSDVLSGRSEEHTSELQSPCNIVCRLLL